MSDHPDPWKTIWLNPRATIRWIVEHEPRKHLLRLMFFGGIAHALSYASAMNLGDLLGLGEILAMSLIAGPLSGFVALSLGGLVLYWIAGKLGGEAGLHQTRMCMAWSWAPMIYLLPLWGIKYILFREELFQADKSFLQSQTVLNVLFELFGFVDFVAAILGLYILFSTLAEVNRFSVWRALGAYALMSLAFTIPVLILFTVLSI